MDPAVTFRRQRTAAKTSAMQQLGLSRGARRGLVLTLSMDVVSFTS